MRSIPDGLNASLVSGVTTLCACWRVTRADGESLGFTDHDRDLTFDGTCFRAASALDATAVETEIGPIAENCEVEGALSADGLTEDDIALGRFDGAIVERWLVDWRSVTDRTLIFKGSIGEISRTETAFRAELLGASAALAAANGRALSRRCDARLGDARCGVVLIDGETKGILTFERFEAPNALAFSGVTQIAEGAFRGGWLTWTSGKLNRLSARIIEDAPNQGERVLTLAQRVEATPTPGDLAECVVGCDGSAETCRERFDNLRNFRGFPHIPGDDWIAGSPHRHTRLDGGSRHDG